MIAPINVIPPQLQAPDGGQVNPKNINANIQQSNLSVTAANSPDLLAPPSLKKSSTVPAAKTLSQSAALFSKTPHYPNNQFTISTSKKEPVADLDLPAPSSLSRPAPVSNLSTGTIVAQNDVIPLPPPSQVTPQPPTNPLPSGPPPVEPANYPRSSNIYYNQNYIGPAISFGNNTTVGAVSRFGLGKNISVRPSIYLGNSTRIAVPFTYDFGFNENEHFEKNPLVILHAGGGLNYDSNNGGNGSSLNPLVVFGADVYLGDGASVLLQLGNTFDSNFVGVIGVGLQF